MLVAKHLLGYGYPSMRWNLLAALALLTSAVSSWGQQMVIPRGSVWKYFTYGEAPTNWSQPGFNDGPWLSGPTQLGYGEGDERTLLSDDPGDAAPTLYFRRTFAVTNPPIAAIMTLRLLADDGAVVHLNGTEVTRWNMPAGPVSHTTPALLNIQTNENNFVQIGFYGYNLRTNLNTLAVEVHQHPAGRLDCSFDLELLMNTPVGRPEVAITSPADGAIVAPGDIVLEASTSDPAGHVVEVQFETNGVYLGRAVSAPFSLRWQDPPAGRYRVTARAFSVFSATGESQPVHVQVGTFMGLQLAHGPSLQSGSTTGLVVRWQTDWISDSIVRCGTNENSLALAWTNAALTADHEVKIAGLQPDTDYFYSIGSTTEALAGGSAFHFHTAPTEARPVRIWVVGDSGTADVNARGVRDAYYAVTGAARTDLMLMLGDNVYGHADDPDYETAVFDMYGDLLRQTVVWPTLGNHDADDDLGFYGTSGAGYLDAFTLPKNGEAGGVASGSELYYSFDYANLHLVCLDSYLSDRSLNRPMLTWLANDLAATDKDWIIAYWHHPPYSWGGHNSDEDPNQIEIRERVLPILEDFGVDLVLSGHSHSYERSVLLDGHYGYSWQLHPSMVLDAGPGRPETSGPYRKPAGGLGAHRGTVYSVCGCSGQGGEGPFARHPVMATNQGGYGSMILEIDGLHLNAQFLRPSMAIDDSFAMDKSAPTTIQPHLEIVRGSNGPVISWPTSKPAFALEWADALAAFHWEPATDLVRTNARRKSATIETNGLRRFFQLRAEP